MAEDLLSVHGVFLLGAHGPDIARHFQTGEELGVARFSPMTDSFTQWVLSAGEKLGHCLTSSSRIASSLSRQFFFSWAIAGS